MELNVTDTEFSNVFNEIMIEMVGKDIWDELERMITAGCLPSNFIYNMKK